MDTLNAENHDHELLERVLRGVASTQESDQAREVIMAMLKDAARYEFVRENVGRLIVSTSGHNVVLIGVNMNLGTPDPQTLDQAIDAALEREEQQQSLVLGQCPKCWAINRHEESCPDHPVRR